MKKFTWGFAFFAALCASCCAARAQTPRIAALFPAGAKAGETVEVAVKGGGLAGAQKVLILGAPGVTAELSPNSKNVSLSPEQWAATVDRMINARGAEIAKPERDKIVGYLQGMAKAGQITAKITIAPDAAPGKRELRLVTSGNGASSAATFEVGNVPEVLTTTTTPGTKWDNAPTLSVPVVVNATMTSSGQRDYFSFVVQKNQKISFDLKANRLNPQSEGFFSPVLVLYDASGKEVAKNLGRFGIDPAFSYTPTENGTVTLLVRDLLWKGSPASVYRLSVGVGPLRGGVLYPPFARPGQGFSGRLASPGDRYEAADSVSLTVPLGQNADGDGLTTVLVQGAEARLLVRDIAPGGEPNGAALEPALPLPGVFWGRITRADQTDVFMVRAQSGGTGLELYARRLGSPLVAQVVIKNAKGAVVARKIAGSDNSDDIRIASAFPTPGDYRVEINDANGGEGATDNVYAWESLSETPDFALFVSPDVISVAPGGSTAFVVKASRRSHLSGPIRISLRGLPVGVSALPAEAVLPPDAEQIVFVLSAQTTAPPGSLPLVIQGAVSGDGNRITLTKRAEVMETFRVNNVLHTTPRKSQMVSVSADAPPFTLSLLSGGETVSLVPGGEARLQVRVNRTNRSEIALSVLGLPPGVTTQNVVTVGASQNIATFILRASRDAKGLADRPPGLPPVQFTVVGYPSTGGANNSDFAPFAATPPISLMAK